MTAKELKEQALTEPLHLASYYRFNEEQLKNFCQQLCKEQRDICASIYVDGIQLNIVPEKYNKIRFAPMPEL